MNPMLRIVVGNSGTSSQGGFKDAVLALMSSLERTCSRIEECLDSRDDEFLRYFGPVVGRRYIEESMALIYGRIDPVRLVVALQGALSSDFEVGKLNPSSLAWSDFVHPPFDQIRDDCWSQGTLRKNGVVRGLLSGHMAHCVFESGFFSCLDSLTQKSEETGEMSDWVADLQKFPEGKALLNDLRRRAGQGYSHLSKGIHFEFMPTASPSLDPMEIRRLIKDAVFISSSVALVANASGMIHAPIEFEEAASLYFSVSKIYS